MGNTGVMRFMVSAGVGDAWDTIGGGYVVASWRILDFGLVGLMYSEGHKFSMTNRYWLETRSSGCYKFMTVSQAEARTTGLF